MSSDSAPKEACSFNIQESLGGLATGLKGFHHQSNNLWLGWPGLGEDELCGQEDALRKQLLEEHRCIPVFLEKDDLNRYYYGFSNSTLWPLFHYFPNLTTFHEEDWEGYLRVNQAFHDELIKLCEDDDTLWIHDYQLMLLPGMIRQSKPGIKIGFFLHIPFPSFELFRLLPWREEILEGLLGANLLGFHTYDYARHFLSSVRRILGVEHDMNNLHYQGRDVRADVFPMGIDYDYFSQAHQREDIRKEMASIVESTKGTQVILSIDRLDYTKGIPARLRAFDHFLKHNKNYAGKVTLILIVAPSRTEVERYDELRREIQELVSQLNGAHGTIGWVPVWFYFRSFSQDQLIAFYHISDVMFVTPLRDGMNLVAKEFIASRTDKLGVLLISETTGAASELGEAIVVNPHDTSQISQGLKRALEMTKREQIEINTLLQNRVKRYDVQHWAKDFLEKLAVQADNGKKHFTQELSNSYRQDLIKHWKKAEKRLLFLDYDGTLSEFKPKPELAAPNQELLQILKKLSENPKNHVIIISGRDQITLGDWLGSLSLELVAGHGLWHKEHSQSVWERTEVLDNSWMEHVRPVLETYTDRTPGSFLEEKQYSLAWHYRKCEPELARIRLSELKEALLAYSRQAHLGLLDGNKVLEIKDSLVNKGRTAASLLGKYGYRGGGEKPGLVLAAGDDTTDEDLFAVLEDDEFSIKIGKGETKARFFLDDVKSFKTLLKHLADL